MIIRDHFKNNPVDLAGENFLSPCDGIYPNGKTYDVKSSKFHIDKGGYWTFGTQNLYKDKIEIYYLLAFNKDYTELRYGWRIHFVDKGTFRVGLHTGYEFNIENMKEYDISDELTEALKKYGLLK